MSSYHAPARHANDEDFMNIDYSLNARQHSVRTRPSSHLHHHSVQPVPQHLPHHVPRHPHLPHLVPVHHQVRHGPRVHSVYNAAHHHCGHPTHRGPPAIPHGPAHTSISPTPLLIHCGCQSHHGPAVTNGHVAPMVPEGCAHIGAHRTTSGEHFLVCPSMGCNHVGFAPSNANNGICPSALMHPPNCCVGVPPAIMPVHCANVNPASTQFHSSSSSSGSGPSRSAHRKVSSASGKRAPSNASVQSYVPAPSPCFSDLNTAPPAAVNPARLSQMKQSLPPGFPEYLLHWREAARVGQAPATATKPLRPMACHEIIELSVMMPNGVYLSVNVHDDDTLMEIKQQLWRKYNMMMQDLNNAASAAANAGQMQKVATRKVSTASAGAISALKLFTTSRAPANPHPVIVNSESEMRLKKTSKKLSLNSFKMRSPSLNLGKFNIWNEKSDSNGSMDSQEHFEADDSLTRTYSMRRKVLGNLMAKFKRSGSFRSPVEATFDNIQTGSSVATTADSALPSSISTPVSPVDTSLSHFILPNSSTTKPTALSADVPLATTPLLIETTASLVLADFETDLNDKDLPAAGQSKLMALTTEDASDYIFVGITSEAKTEEFVDDDLRLHDLDLFMPMLKLVEVVGNKKEKMINSVISQIVGKPLCELETEKTPEFSQFRVNMHSTMMATVEEREKLSIDERIFYEFPPELDDIDTLELSTKRMPADIDHLLMWLGKSLDDSTETTLSCLSDDSAAEEVSLKKSGSSSGSLDSIADRVSDKQRERRTSSFSDDSSDEQCTSENQGAEYTEVVALKGKGRALRKHAAATTEYPAVTGKKAKGKMKKRKKKGKDAVDSGDGIVFCGTNAPSAAVEPTRESNESKGKQENAPKKAKTKKSFFKRLHTRSESKREDKREKSPTRQHPESQRKSSKDFEDHYELCFDHSSRSSSTSNFGLPKPGRIEFDIWTSLVTVLHGGCHGDIHGAGFADLVMLFDRIYTTETLTMAAKNVTFSGEVEAARDGKPKKRSLFRNLFRKTSRPLNVIEEVASGNVDSPTTTPPTSASPEQPPSLSSTPSTTSLSSLPASTSSQRTAETVQPAEGALNPTTTASEPVSGKSNSKSDESSQSQVALLTKATSAGRKSRQPRLQPDSVIISKFESRPHLLPQLYQVKCRPEAMLPRDLIEKLLKQYIAWLRDWLQENIERASAAAGVSPSVTMSTASSFNSVSDVATHGAASSGSFGKTLTKLLSPKSPKSSAASSEDIPDASSYVEMFIGSAGSYVNLGGSSSQANDTDASTASSPDHVLVNLPSSNRKSPSSNAISCVTINAKNEASRLMSMLQKLNEDPSIFDADRYLLKICGYEQYLVGEYSLNCFEYIRNCISKSKTPQLMLISKLAIIEKIPNYLHIFPSFLRRLAMQNQAVLHFPPLPDLVDVSQFSEQAKLLLISGQATSSAGTKQGRRIQGRQHRRASLQHQPSSRGRQEQRSESEGPSGTTYAVICSKRTRRRHRKRSKSSGDKNNSSAKSSTPHSHESLDLDHRNDPLPAAGSEKAFSPDSMAASPLESLEHTALSPLECSSPDACDFDNSAPVADLWKIHSPFRVKILVAQFVNVKDVDRIYVQAGVFHGAEPLCATQTTKKIDPQNPRWDEMLEFPDLPLLEMPLSARLSVALCAVVNKRKPTEEYATAWVNLQLFTFQRCLQSGKQNLSLWPMPKGFEGILNPYGVTGTNPNRLTSTRLLVEFDSFHKPIMYPDRATVSQFARALNEREANYRQKIKVEGFDDESNESDDCNNNNNNSKSNPKSARHVHSDAQSGNSLETEIQQYFARSPKSRFYAKKADSQEMFSEMLRKAAGRLDPFAQLSEQEKEFFWRERNLLKHHVPDALPKVLESVRWNCREEVCQMYALLDDWPPVSVDTAITLLGSRYIDTAVREFAVKSLDLGLTDGLLVNYLIQLIQLMKNEPYHDNALARLLLRRSLLNRRFGHLFFWSLKSQIDDPSCAQRWFVMLEMYLRGLTQAALKTTLAQVVALDEIERIGNTTSQESDQREAILKLLKRADIQTKVNKLYNPLNIAVPLNELLVDRLRVMDSAKKPLWLEWSNPDPFAKFNNQDVSAVIYKSGDDLRQDMLTLQVIRIMDLIWRRENLDLKMLPYNCVATGLNIGLIEVVKRAKTVMGIQRCGGRMAALQVDNSKLHKWIKDHNPDTYDNAVDNFTRSCAGYCVATFILGIGDRNPDNIMVNEDGQIFHIDFGHFLGHFKKKFGINRERVPFVLTYDFLSVITKGSENPLKSKEFEAFQRLCYEAYLALHDNAHLLISLFVMMLGTGIPELQTLEDVQYLRRTLQVDKTREEALQYFETQLDEAHGGAWSTKLDWFFHSVKHA